MLSREDNQRLAQLERQLLEDDPEFCARFTVGELPPLPRKRVPLSLILTAIVVWTCAIVLAVFMWWIAAAATAFCGIVVFAVMIYGVIRERRRHRV
ncbi:DUF3040 domain-containing protein [Actinoplanes sp. TBRC 11911]|uniref:DUF3040 domain-containing protein n=1 Tax=Actinoplanes sp. TBRC 11911 TaxID=2729386 RepID=UPI00145ED13A|nr:DUF3040 domain-containing protein [Actinoplanes sp. TBRC 11911]NMO54899.1 DUF3040 domain-containing protein [Actinoplanes sp. TBRC 11911]